MTEPRSQESVHPRAAALIPMLFVASLPRSIAFYRQLGFAEGDNTYTPAGASEPTWACLQSEGARLMLVKASAPVDPTAQAILLYVYCADVDGYHAELRRRGIAVGTMEYPFWAPLGEFRVADPDGFALMVRHT
jgi:hypothetical protein